MDIEIQETAHSGWKSGSPLLHGDALQTDPT
jgi:hypothetical protein